MTNFQERFLECQEYFAKRFQLRELLFWGELSYYNLFCNGSCLIVWLSFYFDIRWLLLGNLDKNHNIFQMTCFNHTTIFFKLID